MPDQGDILLIPVPFTDLSSQKRRPVIVVSNTAYNRANPDVVVVAMTSRSVSSLHAFGITSADLVEGSLNRPGTVRADKIYTLAQAIVARKFGKVSERGYLTLEATGTLDWRNIYARGAPPCE